MVVTDIVMMLVVGRIMTAANRHAIRIRRQLAGALPDRLSTFLDIGQIVERGLQVDTSTVLIVLFAADVIHVRQRTSAKIIHVLINMQMIVVVRGLHLTATSTLLQRQKKLAATCFHKSGIFHT